MLSAAPPHPPSTHSPSGVVSALTCTAGLTEVVELLLAFLKNSGFGRKGVSNFTKSFSVLSFFFFKGLKAPLLPCVREGEKTGGHTQCHPHTHRKESGTRDADAMGEGGWAQTTEWLR